jgi:hypothetical protein
MRRTAILGITTTLMLAVAIGSIAAAVLLPAEQATGLSATRGVETVRRFYAAANDVIATGDPAPLQAVVAPHFLDDHPMPGTAPGRAGLEAYLLALHAADPAMRLTVAETVVDGDWIEARVGVRNGPRAASGASGVVEHSPPWSAVEGFRIAGGSIVERRSDTDDVAVVWPMADAAFVFPVPASRVVTMARLTFAPGAQWDAPLEPRLLFVESGALLVALRGDRGQTDVPSVTLSAGESLPVPAGRRLSATNIGAAAARVLAVTFAAPLPSGPQPPQTPGLPAGVSSQTLAGELATARGVESITVTLQRTALGREARLSLTSAAGPVLLAMDAGQAAMAADGTAWVRRGKLGVSALTGEATLAAGEGLLLETGGQATLDSAGGGGVEAIVLAVSQGAAAPSS